MAARGAWRGMRFSVSVVLGLVALGCSRPPTQLVGVVETDIPEGDYGCVGIVVSRLDGGDLVPGDRRTFEVPELVRLPFSFGVVPPDGDASRRVQLTAEAWPDCAAPDAGGQPIVTRSARTGFLEGQALRVVLFLADRCRGVMCPETQTCEPDTGACVDIPDIPPEDLTPTRPGEELSGGDAGTTAGTDAGPIDGGPSGPSVDMLSADWVLQGLEVPAATDPLTRVTSLGATPTGVAFAGFTNKEMAFGVSDTDSTPVPNSSGAIFVGHAAFDGTIEWLRVFEGAAAVGSVELVGDLIVLTGAFQGSLSFAPGDITAVDMQDAFAAGLELSTGATRWATSFGTNGSPDWGEGSAALDAGVMVGAYARTASAFQVGGSPPSGLMGESSGQALLVVLDPASGAPSRSIGLGSGALEIFWLGSDNARGALLATASTGRLTGLHPPVAGGGGHELAVARLDANASWSWTTYLEGCTSTGSIRVTRNAGAAWLAFTDDGCGSLVATRAYPGGSSPAGSVDVGASGPVLVTLGLEAGGGAPMASALRAVTVDPAGATVGALAVDGSDAVYVGGWIGLPSGGSMLDFGGGSELFTRSMIGGQSNGAAFLWSRAADGTFRGVDSWSNGGAGLPTGESDLVTGIAIDPGGLTLSGWLHGLGFLTDQRIGGGTGYDVGFLVHAH